MDERGESSSSRQFFPNELGLGHAGHAAATQAKPSQPNPNQICKNWLQNPFDEPVFAETSVKTSLGCWDGCIGSTSQTYEKAGGMCNMFTMDDVELWNSISCRDLLALADASLRNGSGYGDGGGSQTRQYGRINVLCDLNEPLINTGLSLQFTPLSPDVTKSPEQKQAAPDNDVSTLVEANQDSEKGLTEQTNQNETPQQKQKRRKHRPKVVTEGKPKRARKAATPKPATPKPDGSLTGKRKYVRRKGVEKSTATPGVEETSEDIHSTPNQQAKRTCKRKIDFDESEKQVEATADKTSTLTSEGVENYQKAHETESSNPITPSSNPITPSKTELPKGRSKRNYTKAKCKIDFLQETHDRGPPSHVPSPNESGCSTSVCLNKGDEAQKRKGDISSEINLLKEQNAALCHHSLESFVPAYKDSCGEARKTKGDISSEIDRIKLMQQQQNSALYHHSLESCVSAYKDSCNEARKTKGDITSEVDRIKLLKEQNAASYRHSQELFASAYKDRCGEARKTKGDITSEIDRIKLLQEQKSALYQDSLESFLSVYTDYNCGTNQCMQLSAITKGKAPETSKGGYKQTYGQNSKNKEIMVYDSVYQQQHTKKKKKKDPMVPSLYHGHLGYNPALRCDSMSEIDALIYRLERLHINNDAVVPYMSGYHEKNALVVYQQDRSLVPYEGVFNPVKRRKQRPKVDLDEETNRVWMLLLENINSKGVDGTDEDKIKWWEEERRVFRGRVDSFIARMHLVQGDRRFSRWKGSVLDSVVGVFLTQNVSDHLSSSAFMSLAARYPLKQNTSSEPLHEEESTLSVKEYQVDEPEDHAPMMLQEANSCEEKEVVNSDGFSKNGVINVDLNENSDSATHKESAISHTEVDETVSSQNSADTCCMDKSEELKDRCKATVGDFTSFVELLHMQGKVIQKNSENCASEESGISAESASQTTVQMVTTISSQESASSVCMTQQVTQISKAGENNNIVEASGETVQKVVDFHLNKNGSNQIVNGVDEGCSNVKKEKTGTAKGRVDWDKLRSRAEIKQKRERTPETKDSMDYEAIMKADVNDVADAIKERGMNNRLAARIKDMLDRLVEDHGSIDLEWLRDVPPDEAKEYLLSFKGLGLKSVECIRLLTLHHLAFPVDTNVGRIAVRLGWVPLQPLPESLQLHLLELYPVQETIQKYLWPRLCKLDQRTLYELHYQMITFGKVFCTKTKPNCNACPLRGECRHFASAFASARLALPAAEQGIARLTENRAGQNQIGMIDLPSGSEQPKQLSEVQNCNPVIEELATPGPIVEVPATSGSIVEVPATSGSIVEVLTATATEPIIEVPASPEPEQTQQEIFDIEDWSGDAEEIPMIKLNIEEFTQNLQTYMETHMELGECDMSKALVALTSEVASIPTPKLKNVSQLRTEHHVYELPDTHPLLEGLDRREPDDPCSYLLAIWTPGETADSIEPPEGQCSSQESGTLCNEETCFFCNSTREANSQTVRGTILIPCRTAMRGSFPLNGTYFQVNEVFADHDSSLNPIDVPRAWLWNLPRRTVYFGTSIPSIFKGLTTEEIQFCFWRGFVCVRGFDQKTRAPRPLMARLHFPASRLKKTKAATDEKEKLMQ